MEYCSSTLDGWWKKWVMLGVFILERWSSEHAWRFGHGMTRIHGGWHVLKWRNWGGGREWIHIEVVVVMMEVGSVELAVCWRKSMNCISSLGWKSERLVHVEYVLVCMAFGHTWTPHLDKQVWLKPGAVAFVSILWTWTRFWKGYSTFCCLYMGLISLDFSCHANHWSKRWIYWSVICDPLEYHEKTLTHAI